MAKKLKEFVVIAQQPFVDARTAKSYRPGDTVTGWELERAEHYAAQGQVRIEEPPSNQPELPLDGKETKPTGPKENKPKQPKESKPAGSPEAAGKPAEDTANA